MPLIHAKQTPEYMPRSKNYISIAAIPYTIYLRILQNLVFRFQFIT